MNEMTVLAEQIHQTWLQSARSMSASFESQLKGMQESEQKLKPDLERLKAKKYIKTNEKDEDLLIEELEEGSWLQKQEHQLKKEFQEAKGLLIHKQAIKTTIEDLGAKVKLAGIVERADVRIRAYEPGKEASQLNPTGAEEKEKAVKAEYNGVIVSVPIEDYNFLMQNPVVRKMVELTARDVFIGHLHVKQQFATFLLRPQLEPA